VGKTKESTVEDEVRCEIVGVVIVKEPSEDSQPLLLPQEVLVGDASLLRQSPKSAKKELKGDTSPLLQAEGEGSFISLMPLRERPMGNFKQPERPERPVLTREGRHSERLTTKGAGDDALLPHAGKDRTLRDAGVPTFTGDVSSSMKVFLITWPNAPKVSSCWRCT
jgi:hypothetical protein